MAIKEKVIIAVAIVAGIALLAVDGLAGQTDCGSGRYNQATGECVDGKN